MFWATFAGVIVVAASAVVSAYSAWTAHNALLFEARPRLRITFDPIVDIAPYSNPVTTIHYIEVNDVPVRFMHLATISGLGPVPETSKLTGKFIEADKANVEKFAITPGVDSHHVVRRMTPLSPTDYLALSTGSIPYYVAIRITVKDFFGKMHHSFRCMYWGIKPDGTPDDGTICLGGEDD